MLQFALKDFKIRYTHSVLGYFWSVLNPLIFFGIYYVVFSVFMRLDVPNYPGFLLLGVALWQFFSEGTANGAECAPGARRSFSPRRSCRARWSCTRRSSAPG